MFNMFAIMCECVVRRLVSPMRQAHPSVMNLPVDIQ
jgi:hypothetical protein